VSRTVIVGAGSAGAVIASRMSERAEHEVVLVEAGPDHPPGHPLPADLANGTRNSMNAHDWGFRHHPMRGRGTARLPRGKVVGGSSAVNTCIALRGQPADYDEWASLGLADWSWERCLPAFIRLERDLDRGGPFHGKDGPLPIRRHPPGELVPWQAGFLDAAASLGFEACDDHNDPTTTGAGPHAMNKIDGRRVSAAEAYLTAEVRGRENLAIVADALVRRVRFRGRRVTGVEIERMGSVETLAADRVVLSAGAICTPGILLRSGVGPREKVEALGVTLVADNAGVASRLLDHPGTAIFLLPKEGVARADDPLIQTTMRYEAAGRNFPNEMQLQPGSCLATPWVDLPLVSLMVCVGKPTGRGAIHFASADPRKKPRIDSDFFEDASDLDKARDGLELAWLAATSGPLRSLASFLYPREDVLTDRDALRAYIRRHCDSGYHPCGTAPMGADDDDGAATDGRGRVRGVEGLIVADASLMPTIPSANTNLPSLMIGERFGEWLRDGAI
jgi:choline dehydrogenase